MAAAIVLVTAETLTLVALPLSLPSLVSPFTLTLDCVICGDTAQGVVASSNTVAGEACGCCCWCCIPTTILYLLVDQSRYMRIFTAIRKIKHTKIDKTSILVKRKCFFGVVTFYVNDLDLEKTHLHNKYRILCAPRRPPYFFHPQRTCSRHCRDAATNVFRAKCEYQSPKKKKNTPIPSFPI